MGIAADGRVERVSAEEAPLRLGLGLDLAGRCGGAPPTTADRNPVANGPAGWGDGAGTGARPPGGGHGTGGRPPGGPSGRG